MPETKDVVIHQLRQMIVYSFYFGVFQGLCFLYDLSAIWSFIVFLVLLVTSAYEDTFIHYEQHMPETILVLRIWACNCPLIVSNLLIYFLERSHLMFVEEGPGSGSKRPGRPHQMVVRIPESGSAFLDGFFLICGYYLFYFSSIAMFRSLVAQWRFVLRLFKDNLSWVSDNGNSGDNANTNTSNRGRINQRNAAAAGSVLPSASMDRMNN